jgi:hypothetical protein
MKRIDKLQDLAVNGAEPGGDRKGTIDVFGNLASLRAD